MKLFNESALKDFEKDFLRMEGAGRIKSARQQAQMLQLLNNMKKEANTSADIAQYDTVLINLLRRTMPNLVATNLLGVQTMKAPTSLVFAQRVFYGDNPSAPGAVETWRNARPDVTKSGTALGTAMATAVGEALGTQVVDPTAAGPTTPVVESPAWGRMSTKIDKIQVTAATRALKTHMTQEMIQDLSALHGIDAVSEMTGVLQGELMAEIDYELLAWIQSQATVGTAININTDTDGRWSAEKYLGLIRLLDRQSNLIGQQTRRGRATWIVTTPDVAGALEMTGKIHNDYEYGADSMDVNVTGITYVGKLAKKYDVYIDPYATPGTNFALLGYKGSDTDAGGFYCPYVPLSFHQTKDPQTFEEILGVKTRYGIVHNPYASGAAGANPYFRSVAITNL